MSAATECLFPAQASQNGPIKATSGSVVKLPVGQNNTSVPEKVEIDSSSLVMELVDESENAFHFLEVVSDENLTEKLGNVFYIGKNKVNFSAVLWYRYFFTGMVV